MRRKRDLSRRRFLKGAALGAAAVTVNPILSLRSAYGANPGNPGKFVVLINLLGGNDGLNMVVPAHLPAYVSRRANINLVDHLPDPTNEPLLDLDANYKLHYKLTNLKNLWDDSQMHVVHKVSYPNPNQSHFTSQDIYSYGIRDNESDGDGRGWLGRFADEYCADPVEPLGVISVGLGRRRDFEAETTDPLILSNIGSFRVDPDTEHSSDHLLRVKTVTDTLDTDPVPVVEPALSIFSANRQAYELVERVQAGTAGWTDPVGYPTHNIGQFMRTVSQLLHAHDSFQTRIFYTGFGGFDTHSDQHSDGTDPDKGNRHQILMQRLDEAIGKFAQDMEGKGKWDDCVIVVISEFGRRVFENGSTGTDHGWGNAFLVCGGNVKGKAMTGDIVNDDLLGNYLPFGYDFRDIYSNIVESHIGVNPAPLFPDPGYTRSTSDIDLI
ncbi:MAG: DUF1501 domain-containing protein [Planctomycetota bacterium]|jgi:uncharacterized protein (DUF1501 family)